MITPFVRLQNDLTLLYVANISLQENSNHNGILSLGGVVTL